jgi:hypothetical protein
LIVYIIVLKLDPVKRVNSKSGRPGTGTGSSLKKIGKGKTQRPGKTRYDDEWDCLNKTEPPVSYLVKLRLPNPPTYIELNQDLEFNQGLGNAKSRSAYPLEN